MRKNIAAALAALFGKAQAQTLTTFAALSALSLEVLHIPLTPVIWSAIGGAMYLGLSAPPATNATRGQTIVQILLTIVGVPVGALFAVTLAGSAGLADDSLWISVLAVLFGFGIHRMLPLASERLGTKLEEKLDQLFGKAGV